MKTRFEVREELDRLFPGESNDKRFEEWAKLADEGLAVAAEGRLRRWAKEAAQKLKQNFVETERRLQQVASYTELSTLEAPCELLIQGFSDIGVVSFSDFGISLKVIEILQPNIGLARYAANVSVLKNDRSAESNINYDEIPKIITAINHLKRVDPGITRFKGFQAIWKAESGFSIGIFSENGRINGLITVGIESVFFNSLEKFDKLSEMFGNAKSYIDSHLQQKGDVDFVLREKLRQEKANFMEGLPDLVESRLSSFYEILSKKYHQLTYKDEYGFRDESQFSLEIERFVSKVFADVPKEFFEIIGLIVLQRARDFALDPDNRSANILDISTPLDYEKYCESAFSRVGWETSMTPRSGDQGADILLKYRDVIGVVQCKFYSQPVGNSAVQEVIAAREYYKASIGIVISNAEYTVSARQLAGTANVALLNHADIADFSLKFGVNV
jgi:restriction system protein